MSRSVVRALDLLDLVAAGSGTLGELAEATGTHKSTVLRLLRVLEDAGYVHHDTARGGEHRYALGPHLFHLAQQALDSFDVRAVAGNRLRRLCDDVGQTVHLAVFDGRVVTYVDKLEPRAAAVRMSSRIGSTAALHSTAVGKVFLAGLAVPEREGLLASLELPRSTPATLTRVPDVLAEVARVAARGWAQDHLEDETFVNCVGAPVHGPHGRVVAAVSISAPDVLLPHEGVLGLVPDLLAATADVSRSCGSPPPAPHPDQQEDTP